MINSITNSLNKKFTFVIMLGFLGTSVLFMVVFTKFYAEQLERERAQVRVKNDKIVEIIIQNAEMKQELKNIVRKNTAHILKTKMLFGGYETSFLYDYFNPWFNPDFHDNELNIRPEILQRIFDNQKTSDLALPIDNYSYESRYQAAQTAIRLVFAGGVLIILMMMVIYILINYHVINPVEKLVYASEALARGELDTRVQIYGDNDSGDELKRLSVAFNKMAENLQNGVEEIEKREKFQQCLLDAIPDGIRVIDSNSYKIIASNKAYGGYVGRPGSAERGKLCYFSSHSRENPCPSGITTCPVAEIKKNLKPLSAVQNFVHSNTKELYVEVSAAPMKLYDNPNSPLLIVESIRDLTKDIKFSHQQKLSSVGLLATSVAHEMRNPLGSVRLLIEGIINRIDKQKISFEEICNYMKLINEQLAVCIEVTERLLKMARFKDDKLERVNVSKAIAETIALLDYEAKKNGITVITKGIGNKVEIMASESEIRMLIVNLIQNAFNAMKNNGEIIISLIEESNNIEIDFVDNGTGIQKEKLSRIFEPFFTERQSDKESHTEGTGLGLTITKNIVEKFKGSISVESEVGKGTTFKVVFPKS